MPDYVPLEAQEPMRTSGLYVIPSNRIAYLLFKLAVPPPRPWTWGWLWQKVRRKA